MELREAIVRHLQDFRGIQVEPEQVIVGAGSEYLYGLLIQLLGQDCIYALEEPGYQKLRQIYEAASVSFVNIPMDEQGILLDSLAASKADIVQISPSHHFPTGIVMPVSRRYGLLQWASESPNHYIIEDDYDSELRLQGKPIPALFSIDVSDKVIYFNTFTKSLASTIRISYMILPKPLLQRFYDRLGFYSCTVSNFEQYTLARFIQEGYFEKHINRMRGYYRNLRDVLLNAFRSSPLADRITIHEEDSGLHFLLTLKTEYSDTELKEKALKAGVRVSFLSDYYYNPDTKLPGSEHTAVIHYSGIEEAGAWDAVQRLSEAWK
jgi:GntR family transcriptional regulator/MocR family aminotransferase